MIHKLALVIQPVRSTWISILFACVLAASVAVPGFCADETDLSRPNAGAGPTRVRIALFLRDLHDVIGADQTFQADAVAVAEWQDPRLAGRWTGLHSVPLVDVWNPHLTLVNQRSVVQLFPERVTVDSSGKVRWLQRWLGSFSTRMDLKDFPLDRQRFEVQVVSLGYAPDEVEVSVSADKAKNGRAPFLSITDWEIGPATMEPAEFATAPGEKSFAGAKLWWEGRRYVRYYAIQTIVPMVFIVLMGWSAFFVPVTVIPARISVVMTTMLTIISYRFALGRSIPTLTYLTRFDYFMLATTVLIFSILVVISLEAYLVGKEKAALCNRIDFWARRVFPAVFAVVFVWAWWGPR